MEKTLSESGKLNSFKKKRVPWRRPVVAQAQEKVFNISVEKDEDGYYVGSVVEPPGCRTQAKSFDQLNKRIREEIVVYL